LAKRGDEVIGLDSINDYYDVRVKYGRLLRDGVIEDIEDGANIEYNTLLTSSEVFKSKILKLNLEDRRKIYLNFLREKS